MEVIRLDQVSLWRRTQEEYSYDLKKTVLSLLEGKYRKPAKKLVLDRAPAILDFAELEEYTFVPVKALSSGMVARLGFAIATDIQPDILILDEVLSVGDESFRNKCKRRIEKFWEANATVVVVSHDLEFVRQSCDRVIWLSEGQIKFAGSTEQALNHYLNSINRYEEHNRYNN